MNGIFELMLLSDVEDLGLFSFSFFDWYFVIFNHFLNVIRMLNIIQHIWQSEINNFQILPTIIAQKDEKSQFYFYSKNKKRVLRKKDSSFDKIRQYISEFSLNQNYFVEFSLSKNGFVSLSLRLVNEVLENLLIQKQKREDFLCMVALKYQNNQAISLYQVEYSNENQENIDIFSFLEYQNHEKFYKFHLKSIESKLNLNENQQIYNKVKEYCIQLSTSFKLTKIAQGKPLSKIKFIFYYTPNKQIVMVWSDQLQISEPKFFYSFRYNLQQSQCSLNNNFQSQEIKQEQIHTQFCIGCDKSVKQLLEHQIQNQKIIELRRAKGLSIRNVFETYYCICEDCTHILESQM